VKRDREEIVRFLSYLLLGSLFTFLHSLIVQEPGPGLQSVVSLYIFTATHFGWFTVTCYCTSHCNIRIIFSTMYKDHLDYFAFISTSIRHSTHTVNRYRIGCSKGDAVRDGCHTDCDDDGEWKKALRKGMEDIITIW